MQGNRYFSYTTNIGFTEKSNQHPESILGALPRAASSSSASMWTTFCYRVPQAYCRNHYFRLSSEASVLEKRHIRTRPSDPHGLSTQHARPCPGYRSNFLDFPGDTHTPYLPTLDYSQYQTFSLLWNEAQPQLVIQNAVSFARFGEIPGFYPWC